MASLAAVSVSSWLSLVPVSRLALVDHSSGVSLFTLRIELDFDAGSIQTLITKAVTSRNSTST